MRLKLKAIFMMLWGISAHAFVVTPIVQVFNPANPVERTRTFIAENTGEKEVSVEVSAYARSSDIKGEEIRVPTELFMIYPEQFVLKPKQKRAVRVSWMGETDLKSELPFRILFEQLPIKERVNLGQGASGNIGFSINYMASVYVRPFGVAPQIEVVEYKKLNETTLEIKVVNKGNMHLITDSHTLVAKDAKDKTWKLNEEALKDFRNDNFLAGSERVYQITVSKKFPDKDLKFFLKSDSP